MEKLKKHIISLEDGSKNWSRQRADAIEMENTNLVERYAIW